MDRRPWLVGLLVLLVAAGGCRADTAPPATPAPIAPTAPAIAATGVPAAPLPTASPTLSPFPVLPTRPPIDGVTPCRGSDLTAQGGWQGADGALAGALVVANAAAAPCALQGRPAVQLVDSRGFFLATTAAPLPTATVAAAAPVTLPPGGQAVARFLWRNWCDAPPGGALSLVVRLPGDLAPLTVPATAADGRPQRDTPRCDAPGAGSTLAVGPFESVPAR